MVYVIEGDLFLLSQTNLGVIPATFPRLGKFGGIEQQGNGQDRFEVDEKFNLSYINVESAPRTTVDDEWITGDTQMISPTEVHNKINNVTSQSC